MNDKFILMGLNDEKSRKIAEILKNENAKKILDYLGDVKEASETDISQKLKIPLNTAEYNLNKLVDAGLVKKSKNFFWSKRGKKIPMYNLAKKHIIISPDNSKPSASALRAILPILGVIAIGFLAVLLLQGNKSDVFQNQTDELNQFSSYDEMKNFISSRMDNYGYGNYAESFGAAKAGSAEAATSGASDFSTTNIQVEGVDEADIVKNDGKYIYLVSGNKVIIIDAYPAEDMKNISEINVNQTVNDIFINGNKLIVFAGGYDSYYYKPSGFVSVAQIYDISDKENVVLENEISFDGSYIDSRMIGDYVYVVSSKSAGLEPEPPVFISNGVETSVKAENIYYFPYSDSNYIFNSIIAVNIKNGDFNTKTYLAGYSSNIYVSKDNIYLTYTKYMDYALKFERMVKEVYISLMPEFEEEFNKILDSNAEFYIKSQKINEIVVEYSDSLGELKGEFDEELYNKLKDFELEIAKETEKTIIHKISVDEMDIGYGGNGGVPGHVLNRFSMDEYGNRFRIATTTGNTWGGNSLNHLYVLDDEMEIVGSVEDLAKGEKIYSARFMGDRAYIVTFKKIDPLFVIDLSEDEPEVLGYLKITGYSDYLHPYDENHIIGIGKETKGGDESFSWYQGIKISLFDVSDVENPVEVGKLEIGDRGTDSIALYEPHAFLFDKEKNLLVIPITLAEINKSQYEEVLDNIYGENVWQGAFVLDIGLDEIKERGRISHDDSGKGISGYWYGGEYAIQRSLYMDDVLYTISNSKIKANNLDSIEEISSVEIPYEFRSYAIA